NGTATDIDGRFSFNDIDDQAVLVLSYIGYSTQEVPVEGKTSLTIVMREDIQTLDEVVVTAFGMERDKKALSYSVQELEGESIAAVGNSNITNSLQGKIAGVNVWLSSGQPGSTHNITIRGSRSITG